MIIQIEQGGTLGVGKAGQLYLWHRPQTAVEWRVLDNTRQAINAKGGNVCWTITTMAECATELAALVLPIPMALPKKTDE